MTTLLRFAVVLVTLAVIALVVSWESAQRISPGPLTPSHDRVRELSGAAGCERCHTDQATSFASSCEHCHREIAEARGSRRGLHGKLTDGERCERCHVEHVALPTPAALTRQFALAGIAKPAEYRHQEVDGFALVGKHSQLDCKDCHTLADAEIIPAESHRFLGLSQGCAGCHEDVHRGDYGTACADCHGQSQPFAAIAEFRHTDFACDGRHSGLACAQCHDAEGQRSIGSLMSVPSVPRRCVDCHQDPHSAADATLRLTDSGDCARCHTTTDFRAARFGPAEHAAIGVTLTGRHASADCRRCHGATAGRSFTVATSTDQRRDMARCADCHATPHVRIEASRDCADCHAAESEQFTLPAAKLTVAEHTAVGMELTAPHADLACAKCHEAAQPYPERFPGRNAEQCNGCHRDPHAGQFDTGGMPADCRRCHAPLHFAPPSFDGDLHASTAFPLRGAHRAVACNACHDDHSDGTRRFAGTPHTCVACHTDIHDGQFESRDGTDKVHGRSDCAQCHDESGFRPVRTDFDHADWTGYAIDPAHREAACTDCHGRSADAPAGGRSLGKAPSRCADCHADPHASQFLRKGDAATDCSRCHTSQSNFAATTFDHDRHSRFRLDGEHRSLACTACHAKVKIGDDHFVTRYRPLGTDCRDCHGTWRGRR